MTPLKFIHGKPVLRMWMGLWWCGWHNETTPLGAYRKWEYAREMARFRDEAFARTMAASFVGFPYPEPEKPKKKFSWF